MNGKELPVKTTSKPIYHVKTLQIVNGDQLITIKGDFPVMIQDHRNYSVQSFSVRLLFSQSSGLVKESKLDFSVTVTPLATAPVSLDKASGAKVSGDAMAKLLRAYGTSGRRTLDRQCEVSARKRPEEKRQPPCGSGRGKNASIPVAGSGK